jgi:hypothetical protein
MLDQTEISLGEIRYVGTASPTSTAFYNSSVALWNGSLQMSATATQTNNQVNPLCVSSNNCGVYPRAAVDRTAPLVAQAAYLEAQINKGYYFVPSSSFRLNEASMTYLLPARLAQRVLHAKTASVTLAGRNLGLWTNYAGHDPNLNTARAFVELSSNDGTGTPQPRSWVFRVNLGF